MQTLKRNPSLRRSTTLESIDPANELTWRVDCYNGGEEEGGTRAHLWNDSYLNILPS